MVLAVAAGGAVGSVTRYVVAFAAEHAGFATSEFPVWTLAINVSGSFALGFFSRYFMQSSIAPPLLAALTLGFCGGYTTFSTFSYELLGLDERGLWGRAMVYAVASVALGLAAVMAGASLGRGLRAGG